MSCTHAIWGAVVSHTLKCRLPFNLTGILYFPKLGFTNSER
jgi:hypothetical protein